jgi:hypothetical protein
MSNREKWLGDFSMSLARGECALWLGKTWAENTGAEDLKRIANSPWLAVWSESDSTDLEDLIKESEPLKTRERILVPVQGPLGDVLGEKYSLASFLPYFYMEGTASESPGRHRKFRRNKEEQLEKLKTATLVVGYMADTARIKEFLSEEIEGNAESLVMILLLGISGAECDAALEGVPQGVAEKVHSFSGTLTELLERLDAGGDVLRQQPSIRVGDTRVDLLPLLPGEPPLDQDFIILTEQDVANIQPGEKQKELFTAFLKGNRICWRAFAAGIPWRRFEDKYVNAVLDKLHSCEEHGTEWRVLEHTITAEPGAGLSVCLQEIAFRAAQEHYPTLMLRPHCDDWGYDRLRVFLSRLRTAVRSKNPSDAETPVLIVFDSQHNEGDGTDRINRLRHQLSNDRHRAVVLKGSLAAPIKTEQSDSERITVGLNTSEVETLERWAFNAQKEWMADNAGYIPIQLKDLLNQGGWREEDAAPLLVCLYYVLVEDLRGAAELGKHLWQNVRKNLPDPRPKSHSTSTKVLTQEEARVVADKINQQGLSGQNTSETQCVLRSVLILAGLGCLRESVPIGLLTSASGGESLVQVELLTALENTTLVVSDLPSGPTQGHAGHGVRYAPSAYYDTESYIGLRHPMLGRLLLDFLCQNEDERRFVEEHIPDLTDWFPDLEERFPLQILNPLFVQVKSEYIPFAERVSCNWLRLQLSTKKRDLSDFQQTHKIELLKAFDWIKDSLLRGSSTLLHSRGITRYKYAHYESGLLDDERRRSFAAAEKDLKNALKVCEEKEKDNETGNILTSLGLCYLSWAKWERNRDSREWERLDGLTLSTFREAYRRRVTNKYAAFGLARYLVNTCQHMLRDPSRSPSLFASHLSEALELLDQNPEEHVQDDWNEAHSDAIGLLDNAKAKDVIDQLKKDGKELGYALEALRKLDGRTPKGMGDIDESKLREAMAILNSTEAVLLSSTAPLADLLRYAVFSALPEREANPQYLQRYDLIRRLIGSKYLNLPIWLYDYAMLCFQTEDVREGERQFEQLRKGAKFYEVPRERSVLWFDGPNSACPRQLILKITNPGNENTTGWGRLLEVDISGPVPFGPTAFRRRFSRLEAGSAVPCIIRLRPAGPWAEPVPFQGD